MNRTAISILLAAAVFHAGELFCAEPKIEIPKIPFVKILDPAVPDTSQWKPEYKKDQISMRSVEGMTYLQTSKVERAWSSMYRTINIDLDQYPIFQVHVASVSKQWYLILAGVQFQGGYLKLIEANETGTFVFDLPLLSGLKGKQRIQLKLGVSDPGGQPLANESASLDQLIFVGRTTADDAGDKYDLVPELRAAKRAKPKPYHGPVHQILMPDKSDVDLLETSVKDGPLEVNFYQREGLGIVRGKLYDKNWGAVHRNVTVDLDRFPVLEINVLSSSKNWFLILASPSMKSKYARLAESKAPGNYQFDVQRKTELSGVQTFDLQIGVSAPENPSARGEWMAFDELRFKGP